MQRNELFSFDLAPHEMMNRSKFHKNADLVTTFDIGQCIPLYWTEILPGDSLSIRSNAVVRMQTLLDPYFGDCYFDQYFFFVPNRLLWSHWVNFMGENDQGSWTNNQITYSVPQTKAPASTGWNVGTIADYLGLPVGIPDIEVSSLPFRAYAMIMDQWFRNENTTDPVDYTVDDTTVQGVNTGDQVTDIVKGGKPYIAPKFRDYFSSCLPQAQKGDAVTLPLGELAPVITGDIRTINSTDKFIPEFTTRLNGSSYDPTSPNDKISIASTTPYYNYYATYVNQVDKDSTTAGNPMFVPNNLYTDMSKVTGTSVNQLRLAFQLQKLAETNARSGSRYIESVKAHFGVISPDARMQRAEFLGSSRMNLNVNSVAQTSESGTTPQGHMAAYSVTSDSKGIFSKSFTEHGIVMAIGVARYNHSYQQGLNRAWSRKTLYDYYFPTLASIGEQPVRLKELYCTGNSANDDAVFGYQEAWADYRMSTHNITGEMRSVATNSLDTWHLGDDYSSAPSLSAAWIREDCTNVDRVLAVSHSVSNQLFGNFYFEGVFTRVMPVHSIPGLIDHF